MYPRLSVIKAMSAIAQAKFWARVEDDLLLDIDLGIGHGVTENDPVRIEAARRLERTGLVVVKSAPACPWVSVVRAIPLSSAHQVAPLAQTKEA